MPAPILAGVENFAPPFPLVRQAGAKSSTAGRTGEHGSGGIFVHRHLEEPGPGLRGAAAVRVDWPKRREQVPGKNTRCRTRAALASARASGAATGASTASTQGPRAEPAYLRPGLWQRGAGDTPGPDPARSVNLGPDLFRMTRGAGRLWPQQALAVQKLQGPLHVGFRKAGFGF